MCIFWVTGIKIVCYLGCVKEANQLSTCRAIEKSFHCMHFNFRVANTGDESTSRKPVQLIFFFFLPLIGILTENRSGPTIPHL